MVNLLTPSITLADTPATQDAPDHQPIDLASLALPVYGQAALAGSHASLTHVAVGLPSKERWFRASDRAPFIANLYKSADGEWYLTGPQVWAALGPYLRPCAIHQAISSSAVPFLIPSQLPEQDGRWNPWHQSLDSVLACARQRWVRCVANRALGAYDVIFAEDDLPDPIWPDVTLNDLLQVAFRSRYITGLDHPIVARLRGCRR